MSDPILPEPNPSIGSAVSSPFRPRLTRSVLDRVLGGVLGGIAAHLAVNAWWLRIGWVIFTLAEPILGVFTYGLLWLTIQAPTLADLPDAERPRAARPEGTLLLGLGMILLGIVTLATNFGFWQSKQGDLLLPILVALTGLVFLSRQVRRGG